MDDKAWLGLAGVALAWGLTKGLVYGSAEHSQCPNCTMRTLARPHNVVKNVVLGPVVEEIQFRHFLQPIWGLNATAIGFGAMHLGNAKHVGKPQAVYQAVDAGIGGFLYGTAYEKAGLLASTACHALHNLGADLGLFLAMKQKPSQHASNPGGGIGPGCLPD